MKRKEIVHSLRLAEGMITCCGATVHTYFDEKGIPSYNPKYSMKLDEITCKSCLSDAKNADIGYDVKETLKVIELREREKKNKIEKPIKPIEPKADDLKYVGDSRSTKKWDSPFVVDYKKYQKDLKKYQEQLEVYEQIKLIRFIKNADEKLILKKIKITKK